MKKIFAIPIEGDMLSSHFGSSEAFAFVEVEGNDIKSIILKEAPEHQPGSFPRFVAAHGATDVIAGGIGPHAVHLFHEAGINVFVGAPIDRPENLVREFLRGNLKLSANSCKHEVEGHAHDHHHHHKHRHVDGPGHGQGHTPQH